jgi:hypothetical protein
MFWVSVLTKKWMNRHKTSYLPHGPRDKEKVYQLAAARLQSFFEQMNKDK